MNAYMKHDEPVLIWTGRAMLDGVLSVPQHSCGLIVMPGLGGTFHHERVRSIARRFQDDGFATLIADILTADEQQFDERTGHFRVETPFLASRIRDVVQWAASAEATEGLPAGLFAGATTAAACVEAADDLSLFAIALIGPKYETIRDRVKTLDTPALLLFDDPPTFAQLNEITRSANVSSVVTMPGMSSLAGDELATEVAAREALRWFNEHVPSLVVA